MNDHEPSTREVQELEIERINPPGLFKHPAFSRVVTVSGPMKLIFIAGQTPSDEEYHVVAPGDVLGQYCKVLENLTIQLEAAGATWESVVYRRIFTLDVDKLLAAQADPNCPRRWNQDAPPPATLIGVTRLSDPEFLVEIDLLAIVAG